MEDEEKLRQVFDQQIMPTLGRIRKSEKYLAILQQLLANRNANGGRGLRESQLTSEVRPATHALNKLAAEGVVRIIMPSGDGKLLEDPINNRRELFEKEELIDEYRNKLLEHAQESPELKKVIKEVLGLQTEAAVDRWLASLEEEFDFKNYNTLIEGILARQINLRAREYGYLWWKNMAKYYNISQTTLDLLSEGSKQSAVNDERSSNLAVA